MKIVRSTLALACASMLVTSAAAQSPEPAGFGGSLSLRLYYNRASGIGFGNIDYPNLPGAPASINSDAKTSLLPSMAFRWGRLSLIGSYHLSTDYSGTAPEESGLSVVFRRKEWDLSLGYAVLPNLIVSTGWKQVDITSPAAELDVIPMRLAGPFVGVGVGAALTADWSVYGSVSMGRSKLKLAGTQQGRTGDYLASEFGLRYALGGLSPSLQRAGLLIGYRTQAYRYRDVPFLFFDTDFDLIGTISPSTRTVRQGVDGLTIGVAWAF